MTEKDFKVVIIGDCGVGKTNFMERYAYNKFTETKSTLGCDFAIKKINRPNNDLVRLHLWDIAGQDNFRRLTRVFFHKAMAGVVVFDITSLSSFHHGVVEWKKDLDSKVALPDGNPIPCLLLANKCDLHVNEHKISDEEIKTMSESCNFVGWSKISVKDNRNVEESMMFLVEEILARCQTKGRCSVADEFTNSTGMITIPPEIRKSKCSCFC